MARKNNDNNPLQVRLRARSLPKNLKPLRYYQRLMQFIKDGTALPSSWDVEIGWRNPKTKYGHTRVWRYDNFEDAVSDSREGFNALVYDALARQLRRFR